MPTTKAIKIPIVATNKFSNVFKAFNNTVDKSSSKVNTFNTKLMRSSAVLTQKGQSLSRTGKKIKSFGKSLTVGVTLPLVAMGGFAIKAFSDLETGMQNVASLGIASDRIKELKVNVSELTEATGKDTTTITDGLYQVISAFGDTADTAKILEINAKGATAGIATVTDSVNLTSAVTKAYGDTSAQAVQQVTDLAFQTVKLGQTTFPELAMSIGEVTPMAKELGVAQKDLFGVFATATGVTGNAGKVATQYKGVLSGLMSPTKQMTELYQKMGVAGGKELIAKQGGIAQTMKLIVDNAKATGIPLSKFLGNVRAQTLALSMAGPQYENLIEKTKAMTTATGAAAEAFDKQMESPLNQFRQFREIVTNIASDIGSIIVPVLLDMANAIKPILERFKETSPEFKKFIVIASVVVGAIGPIIAAIGFGTLIVGKFSIGVGAVVSGLGTLLSVATSVFGAIVGLINPVTLSIGAIVAIAGLATLGFKKLFGTISNMEVMPNFIKNFAKDWIAGLDFITTKTKEVFSSLTDFLPDFIKKGIGIKVDKDVNIDDATIEKGTTNTFNNNITTTEYKNMQRESIMREMILQKQSQSLDVNFNNLPKNTTVNKKGDNVANFNLGFVQ